MEGWINLLYVFSLQKPNGFQRGLSSLLNPIVPSSPELICPGRPPQLSKLRAFSQHVPHSFFPLSTCALCVVYIGYVPLIEKLLQAYLARPHLYHQRADPLWQIVMEVKHFCRECGLLLLFASHPPIRRTAFPRGRL